MIRSLAAIVVAVALSACSSTDDTKTPAPSSSGGSSGSTTSSSGGSSSGGATASSSGSASATPKAPQITEVNKMMTGLHVIWTNNDTTCDSIVGERKAEMSNGTVMEKYKVAFTEPGEADNKMDPSATEDMKYTYRVRCKKGDVFSDYSNEMGLNPVK